MSEYWTCSVFKDADFSVNPQFTLSQNELLFDKIDNNNKYKFNIFNVKYHCKWHPALNLDSSKPVLLIPIHNMSDLLRFTLNNLKKYGLFSIVDVAIIDDRSSENIELIAQEFKCSYLRIDNSKGFNFSMLNNIAAYIFYKLGYSTCVLWNSDLWNVDRDSFKKLIKKHNQYKSKISGTKLLYPSKEMAFCLSNQEDTDMDDKNFAKYYSKSHSHLKGGKWRGTVQFGGCSWLNTSTTSPIKFSPVHYGRFRRATDKEVNCDREGSFVTGALMILELDYFIKMGGFNPSLSKYFQDVDYCIRVLKTGKKINYFGKDISFYHAESLSHHNSEVQKVDKLVENDHYLFASLWNSN